jgi:predicted transcriptional regulator
MKTKRLGTLLLLTTVLLIPCLNPVAASNSVHPSMEDETVFLTDCEVDDAAQFSLLHNVPPAWIDIPEDSLWDEHEELVFAFSPTNVSLIDVEWYDDETQMSEQWTADWQHPLAPDGMENATVFCEHEAVEEERQFEIVDEEPLLILNTSNSLNRLLAAYLMVEYEDVFFIQAEDDEFQEWKGQHADLYWLEDEDYVLVEDGDFDEIEALVLLSNTNEFQVVDANDDLNLTTWMNTTSAHGLVYLLDVYDNEDEEFFTVLGLTPQYQPVNQTDEPLENTTNRSEEDDVQPESTVQPVESDRTGSAGEWVATYGPAVAATTSVSLVALTFASSESLRYPISRRWWALLGLVLATKRKTQDGDYQRGKIVGVLSVNQGIHYSALVQLLGMGNNQAAHHLRILESEGLIWQRSDGRFVRFYTADIPHHLAPEELPTPEISLVEDSIPHRILMRLAEMSEQPSKTVSGRWLSKSLRVSQQLVSYHVGVLVKHELVTKQRHGLGNHLAITAKGLGMLAGNDFHSESSTEPMLARFADQTASSSDF